MSCGVVAPKIRHRTFEIHRHSGHGLSQPGRLEGGLLAAGLGGRRRLDRQPLLRRPRLPAAALEELLVWAPVS